MKKKEFLKWILDNAKPGKKFKKEFKNKLDCIINSKILKYKNKEVDSMFIDMESMIEDNNGKE